MQAKGEVKCFKKRGSSRQATWMSEVCGSLVHSAKKRNTRTEPSFGHMDMDNNIWTPTLAQNTTQAGCMIGRYGRQQPTFETVETLRSTVLAGQLQQPKTPRLGLGVRPHGSHKKADIRKHEETAQETAHAPCRGPAVTAPPPPRSCHSCTPAVRRGARASPATVPRLRPEQASGQAGRLPKLATPGPKQARSGDPRPGHQRELSAPSWV